MEVVSASSSAAAAAASSREWEGQQALTVRVLRGGRGQGGERVLRLEVRVRVRVCVCVCWLGCWGICGSGFGGWRSGLAYPSMPRIHTQVTTDASVGAMASFLYALEVGERDFPELKRDQRWVCLCGF